MERTPRKEKVLAVSEIREKLSKAQVSVLTDYRGINVELMTELRSRMREAGVEYAVTKNTLTRLALSELGVEGLDEHLEGPTAIAYGFSDPVAPAKVIASFQKDAKKLEVKAGLLGGRVINEADVKALAALPSQEVLLGRVAGCLAAPMISLASVLSAPIRNVGYALEAIRAKREEEAQTA